MAPRTVVGQWLLASSIGDDPREEQRLARALNGGRDGMNVDEPAVASAFCDVVLQSAAALVTRDRVVAMATEFLQHPATGKYDFSENDVHQMIVASMDHSEAPPLTPGQAFLLQTLLAAFALLKMRADAATVEDLIRQAEDHAFTAGYSPPLVVNIE